MYSEEDLLQLSALQHLIFCERQCAFIHIEQLWYENKYTAQGQILHEKVHSDHVKTKGEIRIEYGVGLRSLKLGLTGKADVVEYYFLNSKIKKPSTVKPVEYKRGKPKLDFSDSVQLCAQALCIEEMLGIEIRSGDIFYGKTRRRKEIFFDEKLREKTIDASKRLHELISREETPLPVYSKRCISCSFFDICKPRSLSKRRSAIRFIHMQVQNLIQENIQGEVH